MKSKIKELYNLSGWKLLLLLPLIAFGLTGCASPDYSGVMSAPDEEDTNLMAAARLHVGDTITITLSGIPDQIPLMDKTINEDGTFTMDAIGVVKAGGKTPGELEAIIHDAYVPKIYTHLTVTVKPGDRVFYVRGEVKQPGRQIYVGQMTVTKAITSCGDFTDFANEKKVWLTRVNGNRYKINAQAILNGEAPDPPVFPGDQIEVTRRLY